METSPSFSLRPENRSGLPARAGPPSMYPLAFPGASVFPAGGHQALDVLMRPFYDTFSFPLRRVLGTNSLGRKTSAYLTPYETASFLRWFCKTNQANVSSFGVENKLQYMESRVVEIQSLGLIVS